MSIFEEVYQEYFCDHIGSLHLTLFKDQGGATHYRSQCLDCGASVATHKKDDLTSVQRRDAIPWDDSLSDARHARIGLIIEQRMKEERDKRHQDFTERHREATHGERWLKLRRKVIARCKGVCEGCGDAPVADVHHRHYKRLGSEFLFDLVGLCRDCHERMHQRGNYAVIPDLDEDDADYEF